VIKKAGCDINYIRQNNAGPSSARNQGIATAKSDLIAFLDADDQWTPDRIKKQIDLIECNPEIALVAGDMAEIDIQDRVIVPSVLEKHSLLTYFKELDGSPIPNALALLMKINFIPTGTVLVRKSVLFDAGCFNTEIRYGEDLELWGKIASKQAIICLPEILMLRRQHDDNATSSVEPLLTDLVKVTDSVRSWGSRSLRESGVDPDRLVAQSWANLGYWYFTSKHTLKARYAFLCSLREKFTSRAAFYAAISLLPECVINVIRQIKSKLLKTAT
jgi:glycosyltransferase involved in cell wall biosynthesis